MTTDGNRALVEARDWLDGIARDALQSLLATADTRESINARIDRILAAVVPAQEVAELVEGTIRKLVLTALNIESESARDIHSMRRKTEAQQAAIQEAIASLSPPTQGADRLELAAADDSHRALVEAAQKLVNPDAFRIISGSPGPPYSAGFSSAGAMVRDTLLPALAPFTSSKEPSE